MNVIFQIFNTLLSSIFTITGDWGIAVILLTILVKTVLIPFSIKQKSSIYEQQKKYKEIENLNSKYQNDANALKDEIAKYRNHNSKNTSRYILFLFQILVLVSLYMVVMNTPTQMGTIIVPWISSIKMADNYFIIPALFTIVSILPFIIPKLDFLKIQYSSKASKSNLFTIALLSLIITIKAPIVIGIYFITTSLFSLLEEISFRLYMRNKLPINSKLDT